MGKPSISSRVATRWMMKTGNDADLERAFQPILDRLKTDLQKAFGVVLDTRVEDALFEADSDPDTRPDDPQEITKAEGKKILQWLTEEAWIQFDAGSNRPKINVQLGFVEV